MSSELYDDSDAILRVVLLAPELAIWIHAVVEAEENIGQSFFKKPPLNSPDPHEQI